MKVNLYPIFLALFIVSCSSEPSIDFEIPDTYTFSRNGENTVDFSGQTIRIAMSEELVAAMKNEGETAETLLHFFYNQGSNGQDVNPFSTTELNNSSKSIYNKVAASRDFFFTNTSATALIRDEFVDWISSQSSEIFPAWQTLAAPGQPGQIADGSSVRYVNAQGLEYDQMLGKSLIGALMTDQMLNNYLSTSILDEGENRINNNNGTIETGKFYTSMEHKWDEAYGYLFGASPSSGNPLTSLGQDDGFLNKYLGRVEDDEDFMGIAAEIFNAFKTGRAAIVAGEYSVRDEQASIIKEAISEVIAIRAVYYLEAGRFSLASAVPNYGTAFHDISEGYGFIYSLQFTHNPETGSPYFSSSEVNVMINSLLADGENGLWDVQPSTLENIATQIATRFDFTVAQAFNE